MRFVHELTIPKNTLEADPTQEISVLVRGTLKQILVNFPPGCAGMVHLIVRDGLLQILPAVSGTSLHWDAVIQSVPMRYNLSDINHQLSIYGWSEGTSYDHTLSLSFDVTPSGQDTENELFRVLMQLPTG